MAASYSLIEDLLVSPCAKTMPYESIVFEDPEVNINAKQGIIIADPLDSHRNVDAAVVHVVVKGALEEPKIEDTKEVYISFHSTISELDVENTKDEIVEEYLGTLDIFEPPNKVCGTEVECAVVYGSVNVVDGENWRLNRPRTKAFLLSLQNPI